MLQYINGWRTAVCLKSTTIPYIVVGHNMSVENARVMAGPALMFISWCWTAVLFEWGFPDGALVSILARLRWWPARRIPSTDSHSNSIFLTISKIHIVQNEKNNVTVTRVNIWNNPLTSMNESISANGDASGKNESVCLCLKAKAQTIKGCP